MSGNYDDDNDVEFIASAEFQCGNPVTVIGRRNCTITRQGVGLYDITIGRGGVDARDALVELKCSTPDQVMIDHTSDTVKRITAKNGNVLDDGAYVTVSLSRVKNTMNA